MRKAAFVLLCLMVLPARADCLNRFTQRSEGARRIVTLLTGKLTFQAAQELSAAIHDGKAAPIEWVDTAGKTIAKQFGDLKVVRPMPVGCDGNPSGVIMVATFPSGQIPAKRMMIRLDANRTIAFEEQSN